MRRKIQLPSADQNLVFCCLLIMQPHEARAIPFWAVTEFFHKIASVSIVAMSAHDAAVDREIADVSPHGETD
jgi:hypothetical protein